MLSLHSLFLKFRTPVWGMVPPTVGGSRYTIKIIPHKHCTGQYNLYSSILRLPLEWVQIMSSWELKLTVVELMSDSSWNSPLILLLPLCTRASTFLIPFWNHTCMSMAFVVWYKRVLVKPLLKVTEIQKAICVQSRKYEWYLTTEFQKRGLVMETAKYRVFNYS